MDRSRILRNIIEHAWNVDESSVPHNFWIAQSRRVDHHWALRVHAIMRETHVVDFVFQQETGRICFFDVVLCPLQP